MNIVTANKLFAFEDKTFGDEVEVMYDRTTTEIRLDHNINTSFWMQLNLGYIRNQYVSMRDPKPTVENLFFGSPYIMGRYDSGASKWHATLNKNGNVTILRVDWGTSREPYTNRFLSFNINNFIE